MSFEKLSAEEYGAKSYLKDMTLPEARIFVARTHMLPIVQHNYKNMPEYKANGHLCECMQPDLQSHLVHCSALRHLQQGLDVLNSDKDLVKFYQQVIKERKETHNPFED